MEGGIDYVPIGLSPSFYFSFVTPFIAMILRNALFFLLRFNFALRGSCLGNLRAHDIRASRERLGDWGRGEVRGEEERNGRLGGWGGGERGGEEGL